MHSGGIQLLSQFCPSLLLLQSTSSYGPSLLLPSDLIRSLCISRTVMVWEGNVEGAHRTLSRILTTDELIEDSKQHRYHAKLTTERKLRNLLEDLQCGNDSYLNYYE